jgi:hypothetical protein
MPEKPPKQARRNLLLLIISLIIFSMLGTIVLNLDKISTLFSTEVASEDKHELREKETEALTEVNISNPGSSYKDTGKTTNKEERSDDKFVYNDISCEKIDQEIQAFFSYLDSQGYIAAYDLKDGSQSHFRGMLEKLFANPPIVARETDSLFTILTNTAHFYRILGKRNVLLIKDIMIREADRLESMMDLFEQWSRTAKSCTPQKTKIHLPLKDLYEYAGFFLNTMGGQAYLFRRSSHIRLLIRYYCVLTLDRANAEIFNRHGIDILPHLESVISEMGIFETMKYREHYLKTLRELQDKYQIYYEGTAAPGRGPDPEP